MDLDSLGVQGPGTFSLCTILPLLVNFHKTVYHKELDQLQETTVSSEILILLTP